MNTTERIVESYFRLCRNCFTYPDVKVRGGNNRQLDLLAYCLRTEEQYHVETSVTHELSWRPTWDKLAEKFDKKFFGNPARRDGDNTDYARGRNYYPEIKNAYKEKGIAVGQLRRIWVAWVKPDDADFDKLLLKYCRSKRIGRNPIEVLSFRDDILPALLHNVGKSNYDDNVLRTLSLLQQYRKQTLGGLPWIS